MIISINNNYNQPPIEDLDCSICLQPCSKPVYIETCKHIFDSDCLHQWVLTNGVKTSCPLDRKVFKREHIKDYNCAKFYFNFITSGLPNIGPIEIHMSEKVKKLKSAICTFINDYKECKGDNEIEFTQQTQPRQYLLVLQSPTGNKRLCSDTELVKYNLKVGKVYQLTVFDKTADYLSCDHCFNYGIDLGKIKNCKHLD